MFSTRGLRGVVGTALKRRTPPSALQFVGRRNLSEITRHSDAAQHVGALQDLIGEKHVLTEDISKYTEDWTKFYHGGSVVALPSNASEMSKVMKYCHANDVGVVMQGGNTGLVGGAVGLGKELIVSTERMNNIYGLDETSRVFTCDAGVILENANGYLNERGYMMPIDLGSKGSCAVGGNVSTNAGGLRVVKYGSIHANIIGLECILADGTVLDMLREVQKDNCGYQLKHMFIGSEGTLGVITKIAIKVFPIPQSSVVALVKLCSFDDLTRLFRNTRAALGEHLSAFEYMDGNTIQALTAEYPEVVNRFSNSIFSEGCKNVDTYALIEASACHDACGAEVDDNLSESIDNFLGQMLEAGLIVDATKSQGKEKELRMWDVRELIPVALAQMSNNSSLSGPFLFKYDISLPFQKTQSVMKSIKHYLTEQRNHVVLDGDNGVTSVDSDRYFANNPAVKYAIYFYCYGHAGDQNLHLNVIVMLRKELSQESQERIKRTVKKDLEDAVLKEINGLNGSISAEHGIGQQKPHLLAASRSESEVGVMKLLKRSLDPKCILNPGKVLL